MSNQNRWRRSIKRAVLRTAGWPTRNMAERYKALLEERGRKRARRRKAEVVQP